MDPGLANEYKEVKAMLLREFKISPAVYLEKFNTDTHKPDETYLLYSARLVAIFDAYLNSRKIDGSYDKLTDLLVCDRIKSTLSEACWKHILAIESSKAQGWLSVHELSEAVDLYFANRWQNDRPRAGALGLPATTNKTVGAVGSVSHPHVSVPKGLGSSNGNRKTFTDRPTSASGESVRRCFVCGSKSHVNKRLCYCRGTARRATSVEILWLFFD